MALLFYSGAGGFEPLCLAAWHGAALHPTIPCISYGYPCSRTTHKLGYKPTPYCC